MNSSASPALDIAETQVRKAATGLGLLGGAGQAAPRLLALLSDPLASGRDVSAVISQEPGLSVRVLRIANSAFYGQSRGINTIESAVRLLGLEAVRGIAAAACMDRALASQRPNSALDMQQLVRHSLATAIGARDLASRHCVSMAGDAFIGGLLHNLGVAVQLQVDPEGVQAMLAARQAGFAGDMPELEAGRVGLGHERCLEIVFAAWNLPEALVSACCHHHQPATAPAAHQALASLVHLGSHLALRSGHAYGLEVQAPEPAASAMAVVQVAAEELEHIAATLAERVEALQAAF